MVFVKGQSGNPGGENRAKRKQLETLLLPHLPAAVECLIKALKKGECRAAITIIEHLYGKPHQSMGIAADSGPLIAVVRDGDSPAQLPSLPAIAVQSNPESKLAN